MLVQELPRQECIDALTRSTVGRLACAYNNQPYIVPINFAFEDIYLYGFTTEGQKIEWMRANPLVCIEVDEIQNIFHWTSILVFGRYEELTDQPESQTRLPTQITDRLPPSNQVASGDISLSAHAHDLLQSHRGSWWEPACASSTLRASKDKFIPIYYRICIDRITGRRAVSQP